MWSLLLLFGPPENVLAGSSDAKWPPPISFVQAFLRYWWLGCRDLAFVTTLLFSIPTISLSLSASDYFALIIFLFLSVSAAGLSFFFNVFSYLFRKSECPSLPFLGLGHAYGSFTSEYFLPMSRFSRDGSVPSRTLLSPAPLHSSILAHHSLLISLQVLTNFFSSRLAVPSLSPSLVTPHTTSFLPFSPLRRPLTPQISPLSSPRHPSSLSSHRPFSSMFPPSSPWPSLTPPTFVLPLSYAPELPTVSCFPFTPLFHLLSFPLTRWFIVSMFPSFEPHLLLFPLTCSVSLLIPFSLLNFFFLFWRHSQFFLSVLTFCSVSLIYLFFIYGFFSKRYFWFIDIFFHVLLSLLTFFILSSYSLHFRFPPHSFSRVSSSQLLYYRLNLTFLHNIPV